MLRYSLKLRSRMLEAGCRQRGPNWSRFRETLHVSSKRSRFWSSGNKSDSICVDSRLETETNERLQEALNQLLAAGVHKRESDSKAKLRETVSNLKRIFPGRHSVHSWFVTELT
jgi:hypothetical protein